MYSYCRIHLKMDGFLFLLVYQSISKEMYLTDRTIKMDPECQFRQDFDQVECSPPLKLSTCKLSKPITYSLFHGRMTMRALCNHYFCSVSLWRRAVVTVRVSG